MCVGIREQVDFNEIQKLTSNSSEDRKTQKNFIYLFFFIKTLYFSDLFVLEFDNYFGLQFINTC